MLVNVDDLWRPLAQVGENTEEPKGLDVSIKEDRWGIEPALKRCNSADVSLGVRIVGLEVPLDPGSLTSVEVNDDDLKGLVAGVGREL